MKKLALLFVGMFLFADMALAALPVTPGSGANISSDVVGGNHITHHRMVDGTDTAIFTPSNPGSINCISGCSGGSGGASSTLVHATGNFNEPASAVAHNPTTAICATTCAAIPLQLGAVANGKGYLDRMIIATNHAASTNLNIRVLLYSGTPTLGAATDAATYTSVWGDRSIFLGQFDCLVQTNNSDNTQYNCYPSLGSAGQSSMEIQTDASQNIYAVLTTWPGMTGGAWTPDVNQTFYIDAWAQD